MAESYAIWHSRPVFVTSTFRDMHAERDHLHDHVFPELTERLRERFHHLEPIDLRWGVETVSVDEERSKELLVLKVCLAEIERSRPFLIALIGDRYGWIPPEDRMRAAAQEAGYQADLAGKSITALEIEFGVLDSPGQRRRSRFYFRDPLPHDQMDAATAAIYSDEHSPAPGGRDAHARLEALKARIEREMPDRVRRYQAAWDADAKHMTGLEAWGRQVLDDLWHDLDEETREYLHRPPATWQDQERWALEQFIETQCRDFVGRQKTLDELISLATSPASPDAQWGECVVGAPGSGKSALFAELHRLLREKAEKGEVLVLAHAAGISTRSTQVDALLRRWTQELAEFLGVPDPAAELTAREDLEREFARLLGQASSQRRVVCLIDALNQFERTPSARYLTWLPALWPQNARLIATAIPGSESEALEQRPGVEVLALPLLNEQEAEHIAVTVCRRYHKALHPDILRALISRRVSDEGPAAAGIPLWLELALETLLLLDEDDFERADRQYTGTPEQKLHAMMLDVATTLPPDVESLYGYLLQRTEEAYWGEWASSFANLIAVTRSGLRESDLQALMPKEARQPWDAARFAALRRGFRAHLVQRGALGQWDFFHAQMRAAVERRNLADPEERKRLHSAIADHLETLPREDPLRQTELMFHYIGADDKARAARHYGDPSLSEAELAGPTQALAVHILAGAEREPNPGLEWVISLLGLEGLEDAHVHALSNNYNFDLHDAVRNDGRLPLRHMLLRAARETLSRLVERDPANAVWQRDLSVSQERIGDVLVAQGDLGGALAAYRESLAIRERLAAQDPSNTDWQRDLSVSHNKVGDVLRAQGDLGGALAAYRADLAIAERLAARDPANAAWQRDLSVGHNKVGDVLRAQGDLGGALAAYRESHAIFQRLAAQDPSSATWQRDLSVSQEKIGNVLRAQGDLGGALAAYRESLAIRERLAAQDPANADWQRDLGAAHCFVGMVLQARGDLAGALEAYRAYQSGMERLAAQDPANADWQRDLSVSHNKLGDVLTAQGDLDGAVAAYRADLAIAERLAAQDPANADWQRDLSVSHNKVGDVLRAQGDLGGALTAYRESHAIFERLAAQDAGNTDWQRDLSVSHNKIGDVLRAQGDLGGALAAYRESHAIFERLAAQAPRNTDWQRDLSVSHEKVGDVLLLQGDAAGAVAAYGQSLATIKRLCAQDPTNAVWQRHIAVSYYKLASFHQQAGESAQAREYWLLCRETLLRMRNAGMFLDPPLADLLKRLEKGPPAEDAEGRRAPPIKADPSPPHPGADPQRAARLAREYEEALARWEALPRLKRVRTKRPEPPTGI